MCMWVWFTYNKIPMKKLLILAITTLIAIVCAKGKEEHKSPKTDLYPLPERSASAEASLFPQGRGEVERVEVVLKVPARTKALPKKATPKPKKAPKVDHDKLILALIKVESEGRDHLIGDKHLKNKAYGCLQIRKPCLDDVNRACGTNYTPKDMLGNRKLSIWVCKQYLRLYGGTQANPSPERLAKIWNGGPKGPQKPATEKYWKKVSKHL